MAAKNFEGGFKYCVANKMHAYNGKNNALHFLDFKRMKTVWELEVAPQLVHGKGMKEAFLKHFCFSHNGEKLVTLHNFDRTEKFVLKFWKYSKKERK